MAIIPRRNGRLIYTPEQHFETSIAPSNTIKPIRREETAESCRSRAHMVQSELLADLSKCTCVDNDSLGELAKYMVQHGPRKTLATSRRIRVVHNHTYVVDTTKATLVWEHDYYPQLYIPRGDLQNCEVIDKHEVQHDLKLRAAVVELVVPAHDGIDELKTDRVVRFADDKSLGPIAGMVRLEFGSMGKSAPT